MTNGYSIHQLLSLISQKNTGKLVFYGKYTLSFELRRLFDNFVEYHIVQRF